MSPKSRITAILLCFFLGGIGIHKFYLNKNKAGCFFLAFAWTGIPALIALYDFIVLLMTSDQDFDTQYNQPLGGNLPNQTITSAPTNPNPTTVAPTTSDSPKI
jgi:TM2 domain-containing membrane protein YozV